MIDSSRDNAMLKGVFLGAGIMLAGVAAERVINSLSMINLRNAIGAASYVRTVFAAPPLPEVVVEAPEEETGQEAAYGPAVSMFMPGPPPPARAGNGRSHHAPRMPEGAEVKPMSRQEAEMFEMMRQNLEASKSALEGFEGVNWAEV